MLIFFFQILTLNNLKTLTIIKRKLILPIWFKVKKKSINMRKVMVYNVTLQSPLFDICFASNEPKNVLSFYKSVLSVTVGVKWSIILTIFFTLSKCYCLLSFEFRYSILVLQKYQLLRIMMDFIKFSKCTNNDRFI